MEEEPVFVENNVKYDYDHKFGIINVSLLDANGSILKKNEIRLGPLMREFGNSLRKYFTTDILESISILRTAYKQKIISTCTKSLSYELAYHINPESFKRIDSDHSVIALHCALDLIEKLVPEDSELPTYNLSEAFYDRVKLDKNKYKLLAGLIFIFHDAGFTQKYMANELLGAEMLVNFMLKLKDDNGKPIFTLPQTTLGAEVVAITDVHGEVILGRETKKTTDFISATPLETNLNQKIDGLAEILKLPKPKGVTENPRMTMLQKNSLMAIVAAADFFAYFHPLKGSAYLNNYLFRLECIENPNSRMHRAALYDTNQRWVENARSFYHYELSSIITNLSLHFYKNTTEIDKTRLDIIRVLDAMYDDKESRWVHAFNILDELIAPDRKYTSFVVELISAVQSENRSIIDKLIDERPDKRDQILAIWNTFDAQAKRKFGLVDDDPLATLPI